MLDREKEEATTEVRERVSALLGHDVAEEGNPVVELASAWKQVKHLVELMQRGGLMTPPIRLLVEYATLANQNVADQAELLKLMVDAPGGFEVMLSVTEGLLSREVDNQLRQEFGHD